MVVAQALSAAAQTVADDLEVHSLHGYFLRPSKPGTPSTHTVERLRDGRSFSTREVVSEVDGRQTFRMGCSFHRAEAGDEYQLPMADDVPPELGVDGDRAISAVVGFTAQPSPPPVLPLPSTSAIWVPPSDGRTGRSSPLGGVGSAPAQRLPDDPALHACVLAYLSDMTGAAFRPLSLDSWGGYTDASLDHAVWFHRPRRADEWNLFDFQALLNASGRSTIRGTMYGEDGVLYLSMAQELLIRKL